MKKIILFLMIIFSVSSVSAQKYGYIYSKKVFDKIPEYTQAIKEIDVYAKDKRAEVDKKINEVSAMYTEFQKYSDQMSSTDLTRYRELIATKEKTANEFEKSIFGEKGTLSMKQKMLMSPIEEKVMNAVSVLAKEKKYDMIFDLSLVKMTIYQSESCDLTSEIIAKLGY
ncbi:MAG: OmpH family outer membrane protein [Bacteroidetes bacterium]|nr:OmpH family outer membrane protein [Bacteroidota bacterium]